MSLEETRERSTGRDPLENSIRGLLPRAGGDPRGEGGTRLRAARGSGQEQSVLLVAQKAAWDVQVCRMGTQGLRKREPGATWAGVGLANLKI